MASDHASRGEIDAANILFELGVFDSAYDELDLGATLRADLELDSQELAILAESVSSLSLTSPPIDDAELITVSDIVARLEACRDPWLPTEPQFVLQASAMVDQPLDKTFAYIGDYKTWPMLLQHVVAVEPQYEIGRFQSFRMLIDEVSSRERYAVHSLRYVDITERRIDFVQPDPPPGFRTHSGGWRFLESSGARTELVSFHAFDLQPSHPPQRGIALVRSHIQASLQTWSAQGARR